MRRYPELAHKVGQLAEVQDAKHRAIDKITALNIASQALNRIDYDPADEIIREEKLAELMSEAHYFWQQYVTLKLKRYNDLLQSENEEKDVKIERGNDMIRRHADDLETLKHERGL